MRSAARLLKRGLIDIYWTFRGPYIRVPTMPADPRSVLFVCKGNICRSPFAEHLALKLQAEGVISGTKFGSAGLYVPKPISSPENAIQVARRFGVYLENHESQLISLKLVESYDMIVAMEAWQHAELRSRFVDQQGKIFLLPLLGPDEDLSGYSACNIEDPYGGPPSLFRECFDRIQNCIRNFLIPRASCVTRTNQVNVSKEF